MFSKWKFPFWVAMIVLSLHFVWIANHLRWVAGDQVNPWKLGGYGMYTGPSPIPKLIVELVSPSGIVRRLDPSSYNIDDFSRAINKTNLARVFRCNPIPSEAIKIFFDDNPRLRGVSVNLVFSERYLSRDPVAAKMREQGRVQVQWIRHNYLVYGNSFCGNVETGEVSWT